MKIAILIQSNDLIDTIINELKNLDLEKRFVDIVVKNMDFQDGKMH